MPTMRRFDSGTPRVERFGDEIAIWWEVPGDKEALMLDPRAAREVAFQLIAMAARIDGMAMMPAECGLRLDEAANMSGDVAARLVVEIENAPIAIELSAAELVELAAALAASARKIG